MHAYTTMLTKAFNASIKTTEDTNKWEELNGDKTPAREKPIWADLGKALPRRMGVHKRCGNVNVPSKHKA